MFTVAARLVQIILWREHITNLVYFIAIWTVLKFWSGTIMTVKYILDILNYNFVKWIQNVKVTAFKLAI